MQENGIVEEDMPCASCGYNLRTLASDGRCPECGETVARSLGAGRMLSIEEFRRLSRCAAVMAPLTVVLIIHLALQSVFVEVVYRSMPELITAILEVYPAAYGILAAVMVWIVTEHPPESQLAPIARWARGASIFFTIGMSVWWESLLPKDVQTSLEPVLVGGTLLATIAGSIMCLQTGLYVEDRCIAARELKLAHRCGRLGPFLAISLGLLAAGLLVSVCLPYGLVGFALWLLIPALIMTEVAFCRLALLLVSVARALGSRARR